MSSMIFSDPVSKLALEVFRCNGSLIAAGDAIVAPLGLTSARWQVLGAVVEARGQLSVASIARNMGLVRQSVQRVVNDLVGLGLVRLTRNPHHRRAQLVELTQEGERRFEKASIWWLAQTKALVSDIPTERVLDLIFVLRIVRERFGELAIAEVVQSAAKNGGRHDRIATA